MKNCQKKRKRFGEKIECFARQSSTLKSELKNKKGNIEQHVEVGTKKNKNATLPKWQTRPESQKKASIKCQTRPEFILESRKKSWSPDAASRDSVVKQFMQRYYYRYWLYWPLLQSVYLRYKLPLPNNGFNDLKAFRP